MKTGMALFVNAENMKDKGFKTSCIVLTSASAVHTNADIMVFQAVAEFPINYESAIHIYNSIQIHKAMPHWNIRIR
jgi:hypothetical protein